MNIHLPIAQITVDPLIIAGIGAFVGFLSGLLGVGGGFLLSPVLIFYGVPAVVAVSTQANQVMANSIAGAASHWREGGVDTRLGAVILGGGVTGSAIGVGVFTLLRRFGLIEATVSILYIILLTVIGALMLWESVRSTRQGGGDPRRRGRLRAWTRTMPWKRRFPRSGLYISLAPPLIIGFGVGLLAAILGVGGGFILGPAMVYLLGVPTRVMVGTSLFVIIFLTGFVTFLQAVANQTVDIVLAALLMVGGVAGARFGAIAGRRMKAAHLRMLLALLVLGVGLRLAFQRFAPAETGYTLEVLSP